MTDRSLVVEVALQLPDKIKLKHAHVHAHGLHIFVEYVYEDVHHSELPLELMAYGEPYLRITRVGQGNVHRHEYRKVYNPEGRRNG